MKTRTLLVFLGVVLIFTVGCSVLTNLANQAVPSGVTASDLWPDVPRMDGLTKTDTEIPLTIRLLVQATVKAAMIGAGDSSGNLEFIAFTTQNSPAAVTAFYTMDRMTAAGWNANDMPGCTGDASGNGSAADIGSLCLFAKQEGNQGTLLAIVATQTDTSNPTDIYFTRISGDISNLNMTPSAQ